jgi:hypothetical protein
MRIAGAAGNFPGRAEGEERRDSKRPRFHAICGRFS